MRRNRSPHMKEAREQGKRPNRARSESELRVVGIDFKPAPDAQDRLRRLFTLLATQFDEQNAAGTKRDCPPGISPAENDPEDGN